MTLRAAVLAIAVCACGDGGGFPDAPAGPDAAPNGTMSLAWSLVKMADGTAVGCDQVGGVTVTMILRNRAVQGGFTEVFSCGTGMGTTGPIQVGTYDVRFELTGVTGTITTGAEQMGLVVSQNQTTALAPVTFTVNAVGGLDLRIETVGGNSNCGAIAGGGAGVTGMTITLNHVTSTGAAGPCEMATLMIGSTPYMVNCGTPMNTACIERTTAVTASNLPSDSYQVHVRAFQNNTTTPPCFQNDDQIRVPPNAVALMRTLNLASTGQVGCL